MLAILLINTLWKIIMKLYLILFYSLIVVLQSSAVTAHNSVVVIPMSGDDLKPLKNVVTVAKANGDFADPVSAIDSITDASASNPYIIVIAPGVYTLTTGLIMQEYVDIAGSGENVTTLTGAVSTDVGDGTSAIVIGANNAALRDLNIENTGGSDYSIGVYNNAASPELANVNISASGGPRSYGIRNKNSSPRMTNITVSTSGSMSSYGVNNTSSSPKMTNVTVSAIGVVSAFTIGVHNTSSSPDMTNVIASASGGTNNYGVYNNNSSPDITSLTTSASGGTNNYGLGNFNSQPIVRGSYLDGSNYGVFNSGASVPNISSSTVVNGANDTSSVCTFVDDGVGNALDANCK